MSSMEQVKALRAKTGGGIVEVKKALDEAQGDETRAIEILKKRGEVKALKKTDRTASEGIIVSYIHANNRVGTLLTLLSETDFVSRNDEFRALAHDLALHITAMAPRYIRPEDVPAELVENERRIWEEQARNEGKPVDIAQKIVAGKEKKFREELALLTQPFVKDPTKTVQALITENIHRIGENIQVGSFTRFEI